MLPVHLETTELLSNISSNDQLHATETGDTSNNPFSQSTSDHPLSSSSLRRRSYWLQVPTINWSTGKMDSSQTNSSRSTSNGARWSAIESENEELSKKCLHSLTAHINDLIETNERKKSSE